MPLNVAHAVARLHLCYLLRLFDGGQRASPRGPGEMGSNHVSDPIGVWYVWGLQSTRLAALHYFVLLSSQLSNAAARVRDESDIQRM